MTLPDNLFRFIFISYFVGLTTIKAVQADFKFLSPLPVFKPVFYGDKVEFDCTTNDPIAITSLLSSKDSSNFEKTNLRPGKLIKSGNVFTLYNIGANDHHLYKCKAVNQKGTIIKTSHAMLLFVTAERPPIYHRKPTQVQFRGVGESVKFVVTATMSIPKIRWWRISENSQGQKTVGAIITEHNITENTNDHEMKFSSTLNLTNLQDDDDGIYQAVGTCNNIETNLPFVIQVYGPSKPWVYKITRDLVTNASEKAELKCNAMAYPQADIVWFFKDGKKVQVCDVDVERCDYEVSTDKRENKTESTLTIKKVKYEDGGVYRCSATNEHGQNDSTTRLVVQTRPFMSSNNKRVYVNTKHGTEARIECKVSKSYPLPTIKWFYQDWPCNEHNLSGSCDPKTDQWRPLLPTDKIKINPPQNDRSLTGRLTLSSDSSAFYMCQAKNLLGNASTIFEFHRYTPSKKEILGIKQGKSQILKAGDTMVLQCFVKLGYIPLHSVHWYKDGVEMELELSFSNKTRASYHIDDRQNSSQVLGTVPQARLTLTITNVSINDSGTYMCKATEDLNKTVVVTVKAIKPPKLTWKSEGITKMTLFENTSTSVQLPCVLKEGYPKPIFSWFRNGEKLLLNKKKLTSPNCKHARDGVYLLSVASEQVAILCGDPLMYEKFSGRYTCRAVNEKGSYEIHADLNILAAAEIIEPKKGGSEEVVFLGRPVQKTCRARGNPPPEMEWRRIQGDKSILMNNRSVNGSVKLIIKSVSVDDLGQYLCVAQNWHIDQHSVKLQLGTQASSGKPGRGGGTALLVTVCLMAVAIAAIVVIFVWQRKSTKMKRYYLGAERHHYEIDPDRTILQQVNDMPYDPDWEFREDRMLLGTVLGSGAFGQVVKAEALGILSLNAREKTGEAFKRRCKIRRSIKARQMEQNPEDWKFAKTTVAVKMLKEDAGESEYRDLASEIKIMIHIGEHPNIINILGACTQGKRLMLIMEYAPHGSMIHFLREKRLIYQPSWMKTMNDPEQEFTLVDVVMAAYQIARGMEFLASKKCIHRDLAARNVLIGDGYVMKIADFGLARDVYKSDEYVKQTSGLLPVKWMALESLFDRVYTEKSDVWSFGIVLWEIFTLGGTPYPSLPTEHLLDFLSEGKRMPQPHNCPDIVYSMMRECWTLDSKSRPPFAVLAEQLGQYLEENIRKDNPYITLALEETTTGASNYYLRPADGINFSTHNPSLEDLDPQGACGPLDFEPIQSPTTKTSNQFGKYDSPLPILPFNTFEEEPGDNDAHAQYQQALPGSRSSFNEAFLDDDCAFREINQLIAEEEERVSDVEAWVRDYRNSSRSSADEGIGLDDEGLEKKTFVRGADESENREMIEMENRGTDNDPGTTFLMVDLQGSGTDRGHCEADV